MRTRQISAYFDILDDNEGDQVLVTYSRGIALLRLVLLNKGTAFTEQERAALGLEGMLPPAINTIEQQVDRVYAGYCELPSPISKYQFLRALQERQEILFYALLKAHLEEMMPIVYTPTVGEAVEKFDALYQNPRGLSLSPANIGRSDTIATNYPMEDVRMIVVTDSSAILGIGDQGYGGLAIPIGKLALYTAGGGVSPFHTLPVSLDVGTGREDLLGDPFYLGARHKRISGEDYLTFMDQFVAMVEKAWPAAVIQWEDLAKDRAFSVLERYRERLPSFNDDIQGTGAVALAGLLSACQLSGVPVTDQRIVIHGAGAGGIGVAWLITEGLIRAGLSRDEARARVFVLDSRGLLMVGREMDPYKAAYAQTAEAVAGWSYAGTAPTLHETAAQCRATALLGLSGRPGAFDEALVRQVATHTDRPIIFPLSNPTSSSEALPEDLFAWTEGRCIVATGSPFDPVPYDGKEHPIGQGNNAFIFPGLGLGAILSNATRITDAMVMTASETLTAYTAEHHLADGLIYPPIGALEKVSYQVACAVVRCALEEGVGHLRETASDGVEAYVRSHFWKAKYLPYVAGDKRE